MTKYKAYTALRVAIHCTDVSFTNVPIYSPKQRQMSFCQTYHFRPAAMKIGKNYFYRYISFIIIRAELTAHWMEAISVIIMRVLDGKLFILVAKCGCFKGNCHKVMVNVFKKFIFEHLKLSVRIIFVCR